MTATKTGKRGNRTWRVDSTVSIKDSKGVAVKDAEVTVRVETYYRGRWVELDKSPMTAKTNNQGKVSFATTGLDKDDDTRLRVTVIDVQKDGFDWDGVEVSDDIDNPY